LLQKPKYRTIPAFGRQVLPFVRNVRTHGRQPLQSIKDFFLFAVFGPISIFPAKEDAMKARVAYYSESSNTEKLAKAIYHGITATPEKEIGTISEAKAQDYNVIFVGFPVQSSSVPAKAEQFIKIYRKGKC
jgi:hypothetical protein